MTIPCMPGKHRPVFHDSYKIDDIQSCSVRPARPGAIRTIQSSDCMIPYFKSPEEVIVLVFGSGHRCTVG